MDKEEIKSFLNLPLPELISTADKIRRDFSGSNIELCSIMNAKSGLCSQDCRFCAQSARHATGIPAYSLKSKAEILDAARRAKDIGAERFDIVTSGNNLSDKEFSVINDAIREITRKIGLKMCASLGSMDGKRFSLLKQAGLSRYHHNIETSERFFPEIVSTHKFQDRVTTIKAAKDAGLEVCSGGIIGMGETVEDRIETALKLKELDVDSVPINIFVPIKGTSLETQKNISVVEAIKTIAMFRIVLKDKIIKIAAGRESVLKDFQGMAFMAGANGMLIGGYLTIKGRNVEEDWKLVKEIKNLWAI